MQAFVISINCVNMTSKRQNVHVQILRNWSKNSEKSFSLIAKEVKTTRWVVKRTIERFLETGSIEEKRGRGRKPGTTNKNLEKKVTAFMERKRSTSERDIAKKFQTSKTTVHRIKQRNDFKTYKKQKRPKRTTTQLNTAIARSRKLYETLRAAHEACLVMDDESYFKYDFATLAGPQYYVAKDTSVLSDAEKFIGIEKFGKKVLVWQAICQCGRRSNPFFYEGCINTDVYVKECLQKRLLPFMRGHNKPTIFWPDLATAHYAKKTLDWFEQNEVQFVAKSCNPPNTPELRPIERYWALVKAVLRKEGKHATCIKNFKKLWVNGSKKVNEEILQNLMRRVKAKVRTFMRQKYVD